MPREHLNPNVMALYAQGSFIFCSQMTELKLFPRVASLQSFRSARSASSAL